MGQGIEDAIVQRVARSFAVWVSNGNYATERKMMLRILRKRLDPSILIDEVLQANLASPSGKCLQVVAWYLKMHLLTLHL